MTAPKNSKDVILVNCQEVPETICVETRFLTYQPKQKNTEQIYFSTIGGCELNKDEQTASAITAHSKTRNFTVSFKPNLITIGNNTATNAAIQHNQLPQQAPPRNAQLNSTSQLPSFSLKQSLLGTPQLGNYSVQNISNTAGYMSEQMQQTDISFFNTKSVGIQCELDDEIEDLGIEWPDVSKDCSENSENTENEMENFLKFVKDNSTQYKNYKECLICGELCKSNKYFYGHMATHRGPKLLCFKCGHCLEHKYLQPPHNCQKTQQLEKALMKCPHFSCDVTAISRLELYDHINEHTNTRIYKCSACHKGFCTRQEFLRHILIRAKCYTNAKRKRFRLYSLELQKDTQCRVRVFTLHTYKKCTTLVKTFLSQRAQKKGFCKICFKSISNEYLYKTHRSVCIGKFKRRLMRKRQK